MTDVETALKVGIWQDSGVLGDVSANMATISRATAKASRRGIDVLVFPECFLTGYFNRDAVERTARQVNEDTVAALRATAELSETAILVGYYEVQRDGMYNSAMLIGF